MTTSAQKPRTKSAQISLRIPPALRPVVAQAAAIQNISIQQFIYEHGYEAARKVVEKHDLRHPRSEQP